MTERPISPPEDDRREVDPDDAYDRYRQDRVDDNRCMTPLCHNQPLPGSTLCADCEALLEEPQ